jgi:hypothetical protein
VVENAMKRNPSKSKAVSFMKAWVKDPLIIFFGEQRIPVVSSCKYLGTIICSDLSWDDHVNHTLQKDRKAFHFITCILKNRKVT